MKIQYILKDLVGTEPTSEEFPFEPLLLPTTVVMLSPSVYLLSFTISVHSHSPQSGGVGGPFLISNPKLSMNLSFFNKLKIRIIFDSTKSFMLRNC
jgi:hypothetical protein